MGCGATSGEPLAVHPTPEKETIQANPKITTQTSPKV